MAELTEGVRTLLGDQRKSIITLAIPIAVALFVQHFNNIVDSFWVADLGKNAIAALGIIYPLYSILLGIGNGLGIGVSAAIARSIGMKNHNDANGVAVQGLILTVIVSAVVTLILLASSEQAILLMGGETLLHDCLSYGLPIFMGAVFIILNGVMVGMLLGEGSAKRAMVIQVTGALTNIILDPIMIYWMDMGIAGAAWATMISFVVSSMIPFYWYLKAKDTFVRFERKHFVFDVRLQKEILHVGLPEAVELSVMNFFNIFLNMFVLICAGTGGLAVYTLVWRIGYLTLIPALAMSGAMVSACSAEYGMKRFDMIRDAYRFTIKRSFIWLVALNLILALSAWTLADVFIRTEDLAYMHDEMIYFTWLMAVFMPFFSMTFVGSALMQSVKKAAHAMANTLTRNIILTISYWVVSITLCSLSGIGLALIVVEGLGGAAMLIHGRIVLDRVIRENGSEPVRAPNTNIHTPFGIR